MLTPDGRRWFWIGGSPIEATEDAALYAQFFLERCAKCQSIDCTGLPFGAPHLCGRCRAALALG